MTTKDEKPDSPKREKREAHVNIEGSDNVVAIRGIATSIKIVLQNSRPVVTLLLGLVLIGGAIAFLYWMSLQPRRLTGDFNIAVAEFTQVGDSKPKVASILSQTIYQFIDQEFNSPQYNIDIDVEHKNIGVISGEDRAEELAQSINANIIIYGTVRVINENVIISPRFYIANSIRADAGELIGFHQLEVPQGLRIKDLPNLLIEGTEEREKLLHNSEILIYFTQGLTYLVLSEDEEAGRESYLRLAFESIQKAITRSNELKAKTGLEAGNEVLYLFASYISLLRGNQELAKKYIEETLSINGCYGRAYIAQGNVLYDMGVSAHAHGDRIFQDYFDQAIRAYNHALELDANHADCEVQPYGYYLPVKAHTGLGNTYSFLFQVGQDAMNPALAQKALSSFEQVVTAQNHLPKDDPGRDLLTKLAANAQYQSGVIFLIQEKKEQAIDKFKLVIQLEDCTPLTTKAREQLERLGEVVTDSCGEQK
jgi:tetratricopeptide (TPR) repeat protein